MNEQVISKIVENITAAAGMPVPEFQAKVRRIMRNIATKYGGRASGQVASGTTADGVVWSATITRTNASNGETFGRLDLTVNGKTVGEYFDWDKVFEKAGIPLVTHGVIMSSDDDSREARIASKIVADMRPRFDGKTPEEFAALWGSTRGQGAAHFYNYGSERQVKDQRFYYTFMNGPGGIKDTLSAISKSLVAKDGVFTLKDWQDMERFAKFISEESRTAG